MKAYYGSGNSRGCLTAIGLRKRGRARRDGHELASVNRPTPPPPAASRPTRCSRLWWVGPRRPPDNRPRARGADDLNCDRISGIFPDHHRAISARRRGFSRLLPSGRRLPLPPAAPPVRDHHMQIHVLIPVSPPNSTGPDQPTVSHYTTGLKLRAIINSGSIKPSTSHVPQHEKPVAWF